MYLDYIVFLSKSVEQHLNHLQRVLTLFQNAVDTPKLEKCWLFATTINYPGHFIPSGRVEMGEARTSAIQEMQYLTIQTEFGPFFGICIECRRFVLALSRRMTPLNKNICEEGLKAFWTLSKA